MDIEADNSPVQPSYIEGGDSRLSHGRFDQAHLVAWHMAKDRMTRADESALRQLFQGGVGKPLFFVGAALFKNGGAVTALGDAPQGKIAELLVTLEFNITREYPEVEELSKNAGVLGQVTQPWCTIIGCKNDPIKTIELEGKMMSFCRKHARDLREALGR